MSGHHGIPGNEEGEKLAKEGTNGVPSEQIFGIPLLRVKKSSGVI
jgi:hypothetical protein